MQTIVITIQVPDGVQIDVASKVLSEPAKDAGQAKLEAVAEIAADYHRANPEPAKSEPEKPTGPTIEQVKTALLGAIDRVGKTKGLARLREFGVNRVSELESSKYGEVITAFEQLVA